MDEAESEVDDPVSRSLNDFRKFMTGIVGIFTLVIVTFGLYVFFTRTNDQRDQDKIEATVKKVEETQAEIIQTRTESRKIQCDQDNEFKNAHNTGFQHVVDVFQSIANTSNNPVAQEAARKQLEIFKSDLVPLRDCSPQAIEDYYKKGG